MNSPDYKRAEELGLTNYDRWEAGTEHHPKAVRLAKFLEEHDFKDYGDSMAWSFGGDGDNGETLLYQLDAFFELLDCTE